MAKPGLIQMKIAFSKLCSRKLVIYNIKFYILIIHFNHFIFIEYTSKY